MFHIHTACKHKPLELFYSIQRIFWCFCACVTEKCFVLYFSPSLLLMLIFSVPLLFSPCRQMKWPPGHNVIVPGGGLIAGQQCQRHGNVQLCPCHLPECGKEFPTPGALGVSLHPDPLHCSPPQRLGGHFQGNHTHTHTTAAVTQTVLLKTKSSIIN